MDLDSLDQNVAVNKSGNPIGKLKPIDNKPKGDALQPYTNVFDLDRFRETELIHGRWAMLATLGCLLGELNTGVNWVDAGKVELEQGSSYFGLPLPFDLTQLCIIEAILVGGIEVLRNQELEPEKRIYPGDITINISADAPVPEHPFPGGGYERAGGRAASGAVPPAS